MFWGIFRGLSLRPPGVSPDWGAWQVGGLAEAIHLPTFCLPHPQLLLTKRDLGDRLRAFLGATSMGGYYELQKLRYTHDAAIDMILANPSITQKELAKIFDRTPAWVGILVNSDAFKARLAERKAELVDPAIRATLEERLQGLANAALDRLLDRIDSPAPLKPLELVAIAKLGVGDRANRPAAPVTNNNLYVFTAPDVAASSSEWLSNAQARRPPGGVIDMPVS